jgi:hypothetical protein
VDQEGSMSLKDDVRVMYGGMLWPVEQIGLRGTKVIPVEALRARLEEYDVLFPSNGYDEGRRDAVRELLAELEELK